MAKVKTRFFCQSCGHESIKWAGKCPGCMEWNTFVEEVVTKTTAPKMATISTSKQKSKVIAIEEIVEQEAERYDLKNNEFNRVLGGGLVKGSVTLIGGEPGIGKSTLVMQIALQSSSIKTLYVSGEESAQQLKLRADRIGYANPNCLILTETNTQNIFQHIVNTTPDIVVVDSIQTLQSPIIESSPGSVSQVRQTTSELIRFAKETNTPVILIGHITKEGTIAGPKILEHMVDVVLQFEGDRNHIYRLLRSIKNRFGSTNELGIYEMQGTGLREVANPSEILINPNDDNLSGVAIAATLEGIRPMLIEIQALVSTAVYGTPQRSATGFDTRRMNMLLAVLEKRCGFRLGTKDVFLNMAGGIRVDDPSIDLAVVCSILSSDLDISIPKNVAFSAEVGLSGEIRPVTRIDQRIYEAEKLGFEKILISKYNKGIDQKDFNIEIFKAGKIQEIFAEVFS